MSRNASKNFAVVLATGTWHVAFVSDKSAPPIDTGVTIDAAPEAVAEKIFELCASKASRLTLAVPTAWCLCASVSTDELPRTDRHEALRYRLEEKLPVPAEDVVADFI